MNSLWLKFLIISSFRNMWRSPRRTVFNLGAIAAAAAALILFQSFVEGVKKTFRHNVVTSTYGHYQIFAEGGRKPDPDRPFGYQIEDYDLIKSKIETEVAPLAFMSRRQGFFSLLTHNDRSLGGQGIGIDAEEEAKFLTLAQVHQGVHLAGSPTDSIFIGMELADSLGVNVGESLTVVVTTAQGSVNAMDLQVVGIFKSGVTEMDKGVFFIHHATAIELLGTSGAERILIGFKDDDELQFKSKLDAMFQKDFPKLQIIHWHELAEFFFNTMGWLEGQFEVFRVIILLVSTLSIVNVFSISLLERVGEFGTLRAIGTYRTEISSMIFTEAFLQAAIGTLVGVGFSIFAINVLLVKGVVMPPPPLMSIPFHVKFSVPWHGVGVTSLLCILVSASAGIFPALRVSRMNIVEALGRNV
jgi:putative ABC transport system permease protein